MVKKCILGSFYMGGKLREGWERDNQSSNLTKERVKLCPQKLVKKMFYGTNTRTHGKKYAVAENSLCMPLGANRDKALLTVIFVCPCTTMFVLKHVNTIAQKQYIHR